MGFQELQIKLPVFLKIVDNTISEGLFISWFGRFSVESKQHLLMDSLFYEL